VSNQATRLAEELRDACMKIRVKASIPLSSLIPLMQRAADLLDLQVQPAVSEEAGKYDGTWSVFNSGGACVIENVTFDLAADYMTADRFARGWNMVSCVNITTMEQLARAQSSKGDEGMQHE